jgi:Rieske Fe-S protein
MLLVDSTGAAVKGSSVPVNNPIIVLYEYPLTDEINFLFNLGDTSNNPVTLSSSTVTVPQDGHTYTFPGGVGPKQSIVSYSAICQHLGCKPPNITFYPPGTCPQTFGKLDFYIHCVCHGSTYYPTNKAANLTGLSLPAGLVAVGGCLIVGRLLLPGAGLDPAHGYALISLGHPATLRAAAGTVIYFILIGLLALGVATIIRDTAASIGAVFALLYLPPIAAQFIQDPSWRRHIQQIAPMTAGLAIQATRNLHNLPIAPWAGLGVLTAWAAAALVAGGFLLWLRDA